MKNFRILTITLFILFVLGRPTYSQKISPVVHDKKNKLVTLSGSNGDLTVRINYSKGCVLDQIMINGTEVTGNGNVVYSGFRLDDSLCSSMHCTGFPVVKIRGNSVEVDAIRFGTAGFSVNEEWIFKVEGDDIAWFINRQYLNDGIINENFFPCWQFNTMQTWDGALLDNGGVAWSRFLSESGDSYGVNTATLTFWNKKEIVVFGLCQTMIRIFSELLLSAIGIMIYCQLFSLLPLKQWSRNSGCDVLLKRVKTFFLQFQYTNQALVINFY